MKGNYNKEQADSLRKLVKKNTKQLQKKLPEKGHIKEIFEESKTEFVNIQSAKRQKVIPQVKG